MEISKKYPFKSLFLHHLFHGKIGPQLFQQVSGLSGVNPVTQMPQVALGLWVDTNYPLVI